MRQGVGSEGAEEEGWLVEGVGSLSQRVALCQRQLLQGQMDRRVLESPQPGVQSPQHSCQRLAMTPRPELPGLSQSTVPPGLHKGLPLELPANPGLD